MATIDGTDSGETIDGTPDADTINGKGGDDTIHGLGGNDTIDGGDGNDVVEGGDGNDTLRLSMNGVDQIFGQGGDDTLSVLERDTLTPGDSVSGGDGDDTLQLTVFRFGDDIFNRDWNITALTIGSDVEHLVLVDPKPMSDITLVMSLDQFKGFQSIQAPLIRLTTAGTFTITAQDVYNGLQLADGVNIVTVNASRSVTAGNGNTTMIGNDEAQGFGGSATGINHLEGHGGNDSLSGGGNGADFLDGGDGDDAILASYPAPGATFIGGAGTDRLVVGGSQGAQNNPNLDLVAINGIEKLEAGAVLMSTATAALFTDIKAIEIDYTSGGTITPTSHYTVSEFHLSDTATRFDGSQVNTAPYDNVLKVTGGAGDDWIKAGTGNDVLKGGGGADTILGDNGNDVIDGGTGDDKLYGGLGNDNYVVDSVGDLVFENAGEGTDTVTASVDHYLFANIEGLVQSGTADIYGVGNDLANSITGNTGANLLLGGNGNDTINGNAGNDTIYGESGNDVLLGGNGIDYLAGGIGNDNLNGGDQADALYGEDGNDTLDGGTGFFTDILVGGDGNDILHGDSHLGDYDEMDGGAGDDTFYVDTPDDKTYEAANGGTDTVIANIVGAGYYLYANTENLTLMGATPFGVGNELDNVLTGSAAANWLLGGDGADTINGKQGNDVLFGQAGADKFVFEHGTNTDIVGDFTAGTDKIDLHAIGYTWDQVQASFHQNGGDLAIDLGGGDVVILQGVTAAQLHQSDFIL